MSQSITMSSGDQLTGESVLGALRVGTRVLFENGVPRVEVGVLHHKDQRRAGNARLASPVRKRDTLQLSALRRRASRVTQVFKRLS